MSESERMVLGFAFSFNHQQVALIKKNRPSWQKDKYNGIGGHIESYELINEAMSREFAEETGVITSPSSWKCFGKMGGNNWDVWLFAAELDLEKIKSKTDEEVEIWTIPASYEGYKNDNIIVNLSWLIPTALNYLNKENFKVDIKYN